MQAENYKGKRVLITGGLGFLGSSIAQRLVSLGASVTIMDSMLPRHGGNMFNVAGIEKNVEIVSGDIRDKEAVQRNVQGKEIIFSMAAQVDYKHSMDDPLGDTDINCGGHLNILEACRRGNNGCRVIFPGSRAQYGKISEDEVPVNETHALAPQSIYAANKVAAEFYHRLYHDSHGLKTVVFRIANPYGPRAQVKHSAYCIVNWFVRQALEGKDITIFGDGSQRRDYIFVDDVVDAMLVAGTHQNAPGRVYNLGSGTGVQFIEMAKKVVEMAGSGRITHIPWPADSRNLETGDFIADVSRINSELGWRAQTDFSKGLERTVEFYRQNLDKYI